MRTFDAAVIGGGLLGCFAARNLRRWELSVALLEAREDVCTGISRANSAIVYSGCDHRPGTLKAEMTVRANIGFDRLCRELDVPFSRCGSLMVSLGEKGNRVLQRKFEQGQANGVPGLRLLSGDMARELEPGLTEKASMALYAPGTGTVNPWTLGIAAGENAAANGAEFFFSAKVTDIRAADGGYILETAGDPTGLNKLEDNGCETEIAALDQIIIDPATTWQELTEDDLSYIADTLTAWGIDQ